jgi:DNA-binding transcriptional LysR family regulator
MDLLKLKYFYIVAKHQHVTKAAEEIHIAQPALTKSIKLLENELGVPLFYKKGRNIFLTDFGKYLKNRLDSVFLILDNLDEELNSLKNQAQATVKLNVLAASTTVTDAIISYKKKNPNVVFELIQNEEEADCHISVTTNAARTSSFPAYLKRCVMEEKIYLAVPKNSAYANLSSIELKEVSNEGFVNLAGSRLFRAVCDRFCAYAGFKARTVFESDSPVAVRNIIGAGAGVGFWPEFSWGKTTPYGIALVPIENPICQRELIVGLHESAFKSEAVEDFYAYLVRFFKNTQKRAFNQKT